MKPKPLAVILLNWNTRELSRACIDALLAHANPALFDILLADNGSSDGSLPYLKALYPQLLFLDNKENLGFAEGNNRAISYALKLGYSHCMLLNTDAYIQQDILTPLYEYARLHPEAAVVQPAIFQAHRPQRYWNGGGRFSRFLGRSSSGTHRPMLSAGEIPWATGCCMLICGKALQSAGMLNAAYFLYYEDVEFSFRLRRHGYQLHYLPQVKVYHHAGASGKSAKGKEGVIHPRIHYYNSRNKIWLLRSYSALRFFPSVFLYNFAYFTAALGYFVIRRRWEKAGYLLRGIKDGFRRPLQEIQDPKNFRITP